MGMGTGLVKFRVSTAVPGAQPAPAAGQEGDEGLGGLRGTGLRLQGGKAEGEHRRDLRGRLQVNGAE